MIFSDHAAGLICYVELVTDICLLKPFFDLTKSEVSQTRQGVKVTDLAELAALACKGSQIFVRLVYSSNQKMVLINVDQ